MDESLLCLALASALFVLAHVVISSTPLRGLLVKAIGEGPYLGLFSVAVAAPLVWMVIAYGGAPQPVLWEADGLRHLPLVLMPFAMILLVTGMLGKNPTSVGQAGTLSGGRVPGGILRVTRHPVQWAITLWSFAHLLANGDQASLLFFGSFFLLSLLGPHLIDRKRRTALGESWEPYAAATSNLPFAAIITGRNRFSLSEIGWWKIALGLALYGVLIAIHETLFGVTAY